MDSTLIGGRDSLETRFLNTCRIGNRTLISTFDDGSTHLKVLPSAANSHIATTRAVSDTILGLVPYACRDRRGRPIKIHCENRSHRISWQTTVGLPQHLMEAWEQDSGTFPPSYVDGTALKTSKKTFRKIAARAIQKKLLVRWSDTGEKEEPDVGRLSAMVNTALQRVSSDYATARHPLEVSEEPQWVSVNDFIVKLPASVEEVLVSFHLGSQVSGQETSGEQPAGEY